MRIGKSSTEKHQYHCDTCGEDWESTIYEDERGDGMVGYLPDNPHRCKLYHGRFFLREEWEYEYRDNKLYRRKVIYVTYSGHDVMGGGPGPNRTEWQQVDGLYDSAGQPIPVIKG